MNYFEEHQDRCHTTFIHLVQKIALWQLEPLQFKGGRLATLFKKGTFAPLKPKIIVRSLCRPALENVFHNLWRKRSLPWMRAMADPMQISATSGALVAQAAHVIRLHLGQGKTNGVSCFAVFLDIQSAYYRLLRQHSMDLDLLGPWNHDIDTSTGTT